MKGSTFSLNERRPVYDPRLILQYVLMNWINWAAYKKVLQGGGTLLYACISVKNQSQMRICHV